MAADKKPLIGLLKGIPERTTKPQKPGPSNPSPQRQAVPQTEGPRELASVDIDLSEITIPPEPKLDLQISSNIFNLFKKLAGKDASLKIFENEPPGISEDKSIIIKGKTVGRLVKDSEARIYFHKLWKGNVHSKVSLFTNSSAFTASCNGKCIYFSIGKKVISLSYSNSENGPSVMSV